jgi:hypothetical protein
MIDRSAAYEFTGQELIKRILALIPANPSILDFASPCGLFEITGFHCADLEPSFAQASSALFMAQDQWRKQNPGGSK